LVSTFEVAAVPPVRHPKASTLNSLVEVTNRNYDAVVSLGGDGTLLNLVRCLERQIPVLGINLGGRGILNELELQDLPIALEKLRTGDYHLERRVRLKTTVRKKALPQALNEVYLARPRHNITPTFSLKFRDQVISSRMDGIIVSTPTGSTGYSYSAGGPVVLESLKVFIITPVLPIYRVPPLVLPAGNIVLSSRSAFDVTIDGQQVFGADGCEEVKIAISPEPAYFIRFIPRPFKQLTKLLSGNAIQQ